MERDVMLETGNKIHVSDFDDGGVFFRFSNRHADMHTSMTREEAEKLIEGLKIALGLCPKCGGEEWAAVTWSERQGVTPYKEYAECSCGHQWNLEN